MANIVEMKEYTPIEPIIIDCEEMDITDKDIIDKADKITKAIAAYQDKHPSTTLYKKPKALTQMLKSLRAIARDTPRMRTYEDIDYINGLWSIYTYICYSVDINPSLLGFSNFTGIDNTTFNSWKIGECRASVGSKHSQSVKSWLAECESNLYDNVTNSSDKNLVIGSMFGLKACYGYRDNVVVNVSDDSSQLRLEQTPEDITRRIESDIPLDD